MFVVGIDKALARVQEMSLDGFRIDLDFHKQSHGMNGIAEWANGITWNGPIKRHNIALEKRQ